MKTTIQIPNESRCRAIIMRKLLGSSLKSSFGYLGLSVFLAVLWHMVFPSPPESSFLFAVTGLVVFGLWVTTVYQIVQTAFEIGNLKKSSPDCIRMLYVRLVEKGILRPIPADAEAK